jgi:hypothetical protein
VLHTGLSGVDAQHVVLLHHRRQRQQQQQQQQQQQHTENPIAWMAKQGIPRPLDGSALPGGAMTVNSRSTQLKWRSKQQWCARRGEAIAE